MTGSVHVTLYAPERVRGVRGVLVSRGKNDYVVAVSPWPAALDGGSELAVRITDASGGKEEWLTPVDVDVVRVDGADEDTSVAALALDSTPKLEVPPLAKVSSADVRRELETNGGNCREALTKLGGAAFSAFSGTSRLASSGSAPSALSPGNAPTTAKPAHFEQTVGSAEVAQRGLCRIFRWD
jgi:hypothetical protein